MANLIDPSAQRQVRASARVSYVGFGVAPKQPFVKTAAQKKSAKVTMPSPTGRGVGYPEDPSRE